jgi:hypothetical protein
LLKNGPPNPAEVMPAGVAPTFPVKVNVAPFCPSVLLQSTPPNKSSFFETGHPELRWLAMAS